MKALIISSLLFFTLRAMSTEVGEEQKSPCPYANQTSKREAKIVSPDDIEATKDVATKTTSK